MKAVLCPVCNGTGKCGVPEILKVCHGCDGKGWVEVKDEPTCYPYTYVPIPPWPWRDPWPGTITFTFGGE